MPKPEAPVQELGGDYNPNELMQCASRHPALQLHALRAHQNRTTPLCVAHSDAMAALRSEGTDTSDKFRFNPRFFWLCGVFLELAPAPADDDAEPVP